MKSECKVTIIASLSAFWPNELKPKATLTLLNIGKRLTCWTSSSNAFMMKDDVNDENDKVPNGTPKILIPFNGV
jgi:hypothetical protein